MTAKSPRAVPVNPARPFPNVAYFLSALFIHLSLAGLRINARRPRYVGHILLSEPIVIQILVDDISVDELKKPF
jgi:hypothetical protein